MKKSLLVLASFGFALSLSAADLSDSCKEYFADLDKRVKSSRSRCMRIKKSSPWIRSVHFLRSSKRPLANKLKRYLSR